MTQSGLGSSINERRLSRYDAPSWAAGEAMRRRDKSSKAVKPRRQKTSTHCNAPKTVRRNRADSADLQDQLDRRTRELNEALEQQIATSEVLRVISSSSGELAPVFESLLASAKHLCGAEFGIILLREGDAFRTVALHGATAEYTEARWHAPFIRPAADTGLGRVLETKQVVQIADVRAVPGYVDNPVQAPIVQLAGVRSKLSVPMLKEERFDRRHRNRPPGSSSVHRKADRTGEEFRRASRDRHRECAATKRTAPAH